MSCNPICHFTGALDGPGGGRLMVSQGGGKFPLGFVHPMCPECEAALIEHGRLMVLFDNDVKLVKQYEELKKKAG